MLGNWTTHADYQLNVRYFLSRYYKFDQKLLNGYHDILSKLFILDLDLLKPVISPQYSPTGRPSKYQAAIYRSFIIMNDLSIPLNDWPERLANDPILHIIAGFPEGYNPSISSYYSFINRIYPLDERPVMRFKKRKPVKKLGKNKKLPNKHAGVTKRIKDRILAGRRFNNRPDKCLSEIFARVHVDMSISMGLIPDAVSISGDGTPVNTGASHFGRKTCNCRENGNYCCDCSRRFSDPNASWGWDSHNEKYFYGYSAYFLSAYNHTLKKDLPLYLRMADAKRHDSVLAIIALAEFRDLHPNITIDTFISDSASDNMPTYELLKAWNISAVIALNNNRGRKPEFPVNLSDNKVPICPAGREMTHCGSFVENSKSQTRTRTKWRCPRVTRKLERCKECDQCSQSPYGRVVYTTPEWDIRIFTTIPRGTKAWRLKMNERTAAERVNNRVLNHYGIEHTKQRGKKRITFFATIAMANVHLDAQVSKLKDDGLFSCEGTVLDLKKAA